ncbi:Uma2 family endonuclease [Lysinibacillus macroides]|uniref:Uma2 family endonuclease n=1 Tax=Lysinibacillus macroides TaxID=33935 RepID=UPI000A566A26|nr:Uma2 family endonuclease [Lysinibacillus macroides]
MPKYRLIGRFHNKTLNSCFTTSIVYKNNIRKKALYEKHDVKEYWIIDPDAKSIKAHLLKDNKYELDDVYTVLPDEDWEEMTEEEKSRSRPYSQSIAL